MTKTDMIAIIKECNKNKGIKWSVLKNDNGTIILTNDYDSCVRFRIKVMIAVGIEIYDDHTKEAVGYLIYGGDKWSDYTEEADGIKQAIKMCVEYFNSTY